MSGYATQTEVDNRRLNDNSKILTIKDVIENPEWVKGKIFHFWACETGVSEGLGRTLVRNGATDFIGYDNEISISSFKSSLELRMEQIRPDCEIVNAIINGMPAPTAYKIGLAAYDNLINNLTFRHLLRRAGVVKKNRGALRHIPSDRETIENVETIDIV